MDSFSGFRECNQSMQDSAFHSAVVFFFAVFVFVVCSGLFGYYLMSPGLRFPAFRRIILRRLLDN